MDQFAMDMVIAIQVNDGLKHCITSCAQSASEASTPQLRQAFAQISQDGIRRQDRLVRIMEQKGWYVPPDAPHEHIQSFMQQIQPLVQPRMAGAPV